MCRSAFGMGGFYEDHLIGETHQKRNDSKSLNWKKIHLPLWKVSGAKVNPCSSFLQGHNMNSLDSKTDFGSCSEKNGNSW